MQFARGWVLQQTQPVNWTEFAAKRQRYREALRVSKNISGKCEAARANSGGITVLGKRRFQAQARKNGSLHAVVKLTLKEVNDVDAMGKRVVVRNVKGLGGRGKGDDRSPWSDSDLKSMQEVIESTQTMLVECQKELVESDAEVEGLEGKVKKATIMLLDRIVMLEDHERELCKIKNEEALLQSRIAEKEALLSKSGGSLQLSSSLTNDKLQCDEVALSKALASRAAAHCSSVVIECRAEVSDVEVRLLDSSKMRKNVQGRVSGLQCLLLGMQEQLRRMNDGYYHVFFPRPLAKNPEKPVSTVHLLNACPVCGFWYKESNFIPLACGHTYHPFCLAQLAKTSSACRFQDCTENFSRDTIASIGIRVSETIGNIDAMVKTEGTSSRDIQKMTLQLPTLGK